MTQKARPDSADVMRAGFTPGPWGVPHLADDSTKCNCAYVLSEGYAGSICTISVGDGKTVSDGGNDCPPLEEAKGNARLIAQPPDMYQVLVAIQAMWMEDGKYAGPDDAAAAEWFSPSMIANWKALRAVIAAVEKA